MTNYECSKQMTIEQMAKKIPCPYQEDIYDECKFGWHQPTQSCYECKLEWLNSEKKEKKS